MLMLQQLKAVRHLTPSCLHPMHAHPHSHLQGSILPRAGSFKTLGPLMEGAHQRKHVLPQGGHVCCIGVLHVHKPGVTL